MRLDTLVRKLRARGIPLRVIKPGKTLLTGIADDSRAVQPGNLFVAVPGAKADGARFVQDAIARGAGAILAEVETPGASQIVTPEVRRALALAAAIFHGGAANKLRVFGVTGTNGKTTSAFLLREILQRGGMSCGLMGTVCNIVGNETRPAKLTTPGPIQIQQLLAEMSATQQACAMEVSSHALDQHRTAGIDFAGAIYTNLTRDHLDYHQDFDNYFAAKARLFEGLRADAVGVFNLDDSYGARMMARCTGRAVGFALVNDADVRVQNMRISVDGLAFELNWRGQRLPFTSPMTGRYNVQNLAGVIVLALESGVEAAAIREAVAGFSGAPGRLERVAFSGGPAVFVDYAHSPDAMENVLATLRQTCAGRKLTVVFGCGGDRDRAKRPQMGGIAARLADRVVITSDNPRTENPAAIIEQILAGVPRTDGVQACIDRREAINAAIAGAGPGEVVAILGKGHEDYQIFSDRTVHFDDKEEALRALAANFGAPGRAAA